MTVAHIPLETDIVRILRRVMLSLLLAALAPIAARAEFPDKPITMIIPFAPGGLADSLARLLAKDLSERLGQPVIVDFKTGAGGILAFQYVKAARPDGYTILLGTISTTSLAPLVNKDLPFDIERDFIPVAMTFIGENVVVVPASSKVTSLKALAAEAAAKPGSLNYASAGNATTQHLLGAMFAQLAGAKMTHVPYRGTSPALIATMGGEVDVMFSAMDALPYIQAGKLRPIAVASHARLKVLPDVPTAAEAGMPDLTLESFYGVLAPAGTPQPVVDKLNKAIGAALASPAMRKSLDALTIEVPPDVSQKYFADRIKAETARWRPVVIANHITVN